ncbi:MAG: protein kinase domain-containing protein, partial [Phototrophicaceae bacterium]
MAEGLFDGRYRYDYIYPRGRSGETLRAVDTLANDRPVVIKRPAPQDAPPIRHGQEVSIRAERDALRRLSGHPVLTELLAEGQFIIGGISHQYIVLERATGELMADSIRTLAERRERLPLLEMLVIVDRLLDLLVLAHHHEVIYNDVDPKHLFWNRDHYQLKLIDWGNAVFLDGDSMTPQGISTQSDVYQVGELLYFMLTGGGRADVPRDAPDSSFRVGFGESADRVSPELARIISRALHPNRKLRYSAIDELRRELAAVRKPLETERDAQLTRINERLKRNLSRDELYDLLELLTGALKADPGYPPARDTLREIENRLKDVQTAADLDAVKIYLQTANWRGAADLLNELRASARGELLQTVRLLFDWAVLLLEHEIQPAPPPILTALEQGFTMRWGESASGLVVESAADAHNGRLYLRLAERVTSYFPDVILLRPNLIRLADALAALDNTDGVRLDEQRELLAEILQMLDAPPEIPVSVIALRDRYRGIVDRISALTTLMEAVNQGWGERRLPLTALERAYNAAMMLADNMHVIGKMAASSPSDARAALVNSRTVDPINPSWPPIETLMTDLYRRLDACQTYVPLPDASDLAAWLGHTQAQLQPFSERLFDEALVTLIDGLKEAAELWMSYGETTLAGNRVGTLSALTGAAEAITQGAPSLAGWFDQLRALLQGTDYIERHALEGGLGRALADGWKAFDRSQLGEAERLATHAAQIAQTDFQRFVVGRLKTLTETARGWSERNGYLSQARTEQALEVVSGLYTDEENAVRERFNRQMPSPETYLKAMNKGLVEIYALHSTAALRLQFFDYVLQGTLDAHAGNFADAAFWESAATRTLTGGGEHIIVKTVQGFIRRRQDLIALTQEINAIHSRDALATLTETRNRLDAHPQVRIIAGVVRSLREVENALPDWSNAEFRAAGLKLENAIRAAEETAQSAPMTLDRYIGWLTALHKTSAELHNARRALIEAIEAKPEAPTPELATLHQRLWEQSAAAIGDEYVSTLRGWYESYTAFAGVMTDPTRRRSARLATMTDLFRALFIDRHPAYGLYRHWFDVTDRAPEFPAPPTSDPELRVTDEAESAPANAYSSGDSLQSDSRYTRAAVPRRNTRLTWMVGALVALAALFAVGFALRGIFTPATPIIALTISPTPIDTATDTTDEANLVPTA